MQALLRDAPVGQVIRFFNPKLLPYPEERDDFEIPVSRLLVLLRVDVHADVDQPAYLQLRQGRKLAPPSSTTTSSQPSLHGENPVEEAYLENEEDTEERGSSADDSESVSDLDKIRTAGTARTAQSQLSRVATREALSRSHTRADLEQQFSLATIEKGPSRPIEPEVRHDGTILVDWYTTDDAENPQNWSFGKKAFALSLILV